MKLFNLVKKIYRKIFPDYFQELREAVGNSKTLLDIGCGSNSPIQHLSHQIHTVGADSFKPSLDQSQAKKIHNEYVLDDVRRISKHFAPKTFETVVALDLVEHLKKEEAKNLIAEMEKIAVKKVVVFTPNGFLPQGKFENNPYQVHLSGWSVDDFVKRGYKVIGINGLKFLRSEFAEIKFRPKRFWQLVSDLSQIVVKRHPDHAFQLLAVKNISNVG